MSIASAISRRFNDETSVRMGFAAALVMLIAIAAFAYYSIDVLEKTADMVDHTHEVQASIAEIDALFGRARIRWRTYITNGSAEALGDYRMAVAELLPRMDVLDILIADSEEQGSRLNVVREAATAYLASVDETIELKWAGKLSSETEIFLELSRPRPSVAKANAALARMTEEERSLLASRERENREQSAIARLVLIGGTATSIVVFLAAFFLLSRQMRQVKGAELNIRALNSQLQNHAQHLEKANKELESFSYSVSHDLRTPLRAIGGYARMLQEDHEPRLDEEGKRYLKVICGEADRMGLLIDDLLSFSRLGREHMKTATVDMDMLVRDVVAELRPAAAAATQIEVSRLPSVRGDRALLRQVWTNLIGNAIKYAGKREQPRVRISGGIEGGETVYRVEDNGAGFDMRHYGKLFGVFQRLHSSEDFDGTGIGLAIVQRVVTRHGGRVWAEGEPDKGAVFYFSLPIEAVDHGA